MKIIIRTKHCKVQRIIIDILLEYIAYNKSLYFFLKVTVQTGTYSGGAIVACNYLIRATLFKSYFKE